MSTPCAVGIGTPAKWSGVPCKADGYPLWAGLRLINHIARGGFEQAARVVVDEAPFGWDCVDGTRLTEADAFLAPSSGRLDERDGQEVLDRHYAIYLLDLPQKRLHWNIKRVWHSVGLDPAGAWELPDWYPAPPAEKSLAPAMPEAVKKELQKRALAWDVRWDVMLRGMRAWLGAQLSEAVAGAAVKWLVLGTEPARFRVFVGDTPVWTSLQSEGVELCGSDGRLRTLDLALEPAIRVLSGPVKPPVVQPMIETWLDLAWKQQFNDGAVSWAAGSKKWSFTRARVTHYPDPLQYVHGGLVPRLLAWLFG